MRLVDRFILANAPFFVIASILAYGLLAGAYTYLANNEFTWTAWTITSCLGVIPIFTIMYVFFRKESLWNIPMLLLVFCSPIIFNYTSIWLQNFGMTSVAKAMYASRYYSLVFAGIIFFLRAWDSNLQNDCSSIDAE
ncbi:MAG: hypothetical protein WC725_02440 [Patescibacteria group bacterium]|jgi:hypothetical protein